MTEKPEQTPQEIIAKLAEMSNAEFNAFMNWHFKQLCKRPLPSPKESADG
jgi:hypothetical protein